MLLVNQLTGFGSSGGLPKGLYEMSYLGFNAVTGNASNSSNFDIGSPFSDRVVFVATITPEGAAEASGVTVNGVAADLVGASSSGDLKWWYSYAPPGSGLVNITATIGAAVNNGVVAWLLNGGAGPYPLSLDEATNFNSNSNGVSADFPGTIEIDDIVLTVGNKPGSQNFSSHSTDIVGTLVQHQTNALVASSGAGWATIGPATATKVAGAGTVQANGSDSSKNIQFYAIRIRKAL